MNWLFIETEILGVPYIVIRIGKEKRSKHKNAVS